MTNKRLIRFGRVLTLFGCATLLVAALYFLGLYTPSGIYEADFYLPYLLIGGPLVWLGAVCCAGWIAAALTHLFHVTVDWEFSFVVLPGIFTWILGSIQWFLVLEAIQRHQIPKRDLS